MSDAGRQLVARFRVFCRLRTGARTHPACAGPESPDFFQDHVQPLTLNKLHGIIMNALILADSEDGDDVGMVQVRGGPRLPAEPLQAFWLPHATQYQDVSSHSPAAPPV